MTYRPLVLRRLAECERKIAEREPLLVSQRARLDRAISEGLMVTAHAAALRRLTDALAVHLAADDRLRTHLQALENPRCPCGLRA